LPHLCPPVFLRLFPPPLRKPRWLSRQPIYPHWRSCRQARRPPTLPRNNHLAESAGQMWNRSPGWRPPRSFRPPYRRRRRFHSNLSARHCLPRCRAQRPQLF
jgi:CRISPR/Cas system endoribonuclease Cas6 (RAMP superfamily)